MSNAAARGILAVASPVMIASGAGAWALVTKQLKEERIDVHADSAKLAGKRVAGPRTAFEQAQVVAQHAGHIGGGKTFSELSEEYMAANAAGDTEKAQELAGPREMVMQAGFVRSSLYTSVLSYGVAALVMGIGVLMGATAVALGSDD